MGNLFYNTPDVVSRSGKQFKLKLTGLILFFLVLIFLTYISLKADLNPIYYTAFFWIINLVVFLWFGNHYISIYLDKKLPWATYVSRRFFVQLLFSSSYSLLCVNLTYYFFRFFFTGSTPDYTQLAIMNIYGLLFIIPIISINFGIYFLVQWKKSTLQSEVLKKENIKSQLDALKMHLDPHFLFNNLNILSSLIDSDKQSAHQFLEKFAEVYRYVLKNKNQEVVSLKEELSFIESYLFILQNRFGEGLQTNLNIIEEDNYYVPPLALQMLIENAIKHNQIHSDAPLNIEVYVENREKLVVVNNLSKKSLEGETNKSGLTNIAKRYSYLTDHSVEVMDVGSHFIVKIPLLTVDFEEGE